jgi:Helix-turn-helix domain
LTVPKPQITLGPQCAAVLSELRQRSMTTGDLTRATGIMRVGAVVHVLRIAGHKIDTTLVNVRTRYSNHVGVALYTLRRGRGRPAYVRIKEPRKPQRRAQRKTARKRT